MITLTVDTVLDRAAQLIDANGLHTGDYWPPAVATDRAMPPWRPGTPCCAVAAVVIAQETCMPVPYAAVEHCDPDDEALLALVRHLGFGRYDEIARWSDLRTTAEVAAELRAAARAWRSRP